MGVIFSFICLVVLIGILLFSAGVLLYYLCIIVALTIGGVANLMDKSKDRKDKKAY